MSSLTSTDRKYLNLAKKAAASSSEKKRHGAVVARGGRVLGIGFNKFRNHPSIIEPDKIKEHCSIHAEVDALSKVSDPRRATIYVARVSNSGDDRLSKPCSYCHRFIVESGIKKIVYTEG